MKRYPVVTVFVLFTLLLSNIPMFELQAASAAVPADPPPDMLSTGDALPTESAVPINESRNARPTSQVRSTQPLQASSTISFSKHIVDANFSAPEMGHTADLDRDGDIDILGSSYGKTLAWWENDGSQNFSKHIIDDNFLKARAVFAADMDGDADIDVVGASGGGGIAWWENDGSQVFTQHTLKDNVESNEIAWWENDGAETFTKHVITDTFTQAHYTCPADLDADGDMDILGAASEASTIAWWENDGAQNFSPHILDDQFTDTLYAEAADIDKDGDLDILGSAYSLNTVAWWENKSQAQADTVPPAAIDDLGATTGASSGSITLSWTAPGDDGDTGTATSYVVRYNTSQITESNWDTSTGVPGAPAPAPAGSAENMTVSGLTPGQVYHFAIKAQDERANMSSLSNSASAAAGDAEPALSYSTATYIDLRDHGPDPETAIALAGQPVVWTNNGTTKHTVTEGEPIFQIYLPLIVRGTSTGAAFAFTSSTFDPYYVPLFDSGPVATGERFTHTFAATGVFTYYSDYSPNSVVGRVVVMQAGEAVSETVDKDAGGTVRTSSGASLDIGPDVLLTDTIATIIESPDGTVKDTTGSPVGTTYDIDIAGSDYVISGYVTITLPYDPGRLPGGASEDEVRAYYFNGLRWINVGGHVDTKQNTVMVTMTHLSKCTTQVPSENPFGLTQEQGEAFDHAADYFEALVASEDLYKAFTTSDGQPLFDVDFDQAKWLAETTLHDLGQLPQSTPVAEIGKTPSEIVNEMVDLGQALPSYGDNIAEDEETVETIEAIATGLTIGLGVAGCLYGGPLGCSLIHTLDHLVVETLVFSIWKISLGLDYVGEMIDLREEMDAWLPTVVEVGKWPEGWESYPANQIEIGHCAANYQATEDFYRFQPVSGVESFAYANLYQDNAETDFVLALQKLYSSFQGEWGDHTDYVYIFTEYKSITETRASAIRFANPGLGSIGVCVSGRLILPDIQPGSEVKVKYIFVEGGKLDKRFTSEGTASLAQDTLYYNPPNVPATPTPADGATDQETSVDLSWSLDDPNGRSVTYDIYLERTDEDKDNVPDVRVASGQTESSYDPGTLDENTTYLWRVIGTDDQGLVVPGPVWEFTTVGAQAPVSMDQVYTADYWEQPKTTFRPGEAIRLALQATNHTQDTIDVSYYWNTYDPDDTEVPLLSYENWTTSMPPGEGTTWFLTRAIPKDSPLGWYTYNAFVFYGSEQDSGGTMFEVEGTPISINLLSAVTCKDVVDGNPVEITQAFNTSDEYVYVWTIWEGASGSHSIKWEWYRPNGYLFHSDADDFNASEDLVSRWTGLSIADLSNEPGQWMVKISIDDSEVQTLTFMVQ